MPERKDRINPLRHHRDSINKFKLLEPNTTPEHWRDLSDALLDML